MVVLSAHVKQITGKSILILIPTTHQCIQIRLIHPGRAESVNEERVECPRKRMHVPLWPAVHMGRLKSGCRAPVHQCRDMASPAEYMEVQLLLTHMDSTCDTGADRRERYQVDDWPTGVPSAQSIIQASRSLNGGRSINIRVLPIMWWMNELWENLQLRQRISSTMKMNGASHKMWVTCSWSESGTWMNPYEFLEWKWNQIPTWITWESKFSCFQGKQNSTKRVYWDYD